MVRYGYGQAANWQELEGAAKGKAADLVHVPFFPTAGLIERLKNRYYQVTMLERTLVSGCRPKRVRSLFGRLYGSSRTVWRLIYALPEK